MAEVYLILHGWGGNKPEHWQEHLARALQAEGKDVRYPKMPTPMSPNPQAWMEALHTALADIPPDATLTVLAHSLGAINWMRHAAMAERPGPQADRVLLVAPPYVVREVPPLDAPPGAADFFPPPFDKEGIAVPGPRDHPGCLRHRRLRHLRPVVGLRGQAGRPHPQAARRRPHLPLLRLRRVALGRRLGLAPRRPAAPAEQVAGVGSSGVS